MQPRRPPLWLLWGLLWSCEAHRAGGELPAGPPSGSDGPTTQVGQGEGPTSGDAAAGGDPGRDGVTDAPGATPAGQGTTTPDVPDEETQEQVRQVLDPVVPGGFSWSTVDYGLAAYRADTGETSLETHGPGGLFSDLDGDDYPDLLLVTGARYPHELYLNRDDGQGGRHFVRADFDTAPRGGAGAVGADYDNDGDLDVYVVNYGEPNVLYENRLLPDGVFSLRDATADSDPDPQLNQGNDGVGSPQHGELALELGMTAAWADVNRDGLADLFLGNHNGFNDKPELGPLPGMRDTLLLNAGGGRFNDVTLLSGATGYETASGQDGDGEQHFGSTNAAVFLDVNDDRWPDLFVSNKTGTSQDQDLLYLNRGADGDGQWLGFEAVSYGLPLHKELVWPMAVAVADVDGDGDLDMHMTDRAMDGTLINQQADTGSLGFVMRRQWGTPWAWGAVFCDFDNSGWLDLHVTTWSASSDLLIHEVGKDETERARDWGLHQRREARGNLVADVDRDGWPELLVLNLAGPSAFYRNKLKLDADGPRHYLSVKLQGDPEAPGPLRSTRDALGAAVLVRADVDGDGSLETLRRDVLSGNGNAASGHSMRLHFGLGRARRVELHVRWPSGADSLLLNVPVDQELTLREADAN